MKHVESMKVHGTSSTDIKVADKMTSIKQKYAKCRQTAQSISNYITAKHSVSMTNVYWFSQFDT